MIKKSKSFFHLLYMAYNDNLLIVLTICAFLSIFLSYFNEKCECYTKLHEQQQSKLILNYYKHTYIFKLFKLELKKNEQRHAFGLD